MRVLKAAGAYFALVFAAGVALGVLREVWVKGMIGPRAAEMAELPVMIGVSALAAFWVVRKFRVRMNVGPRLAVGAIALVFLLAAELAVVFFVRGQSIEAYLDSRDPTALTAYGLALILFALMPAVVSGELGARIRRR
jgi:hypothetical protein